MTVLRRRAVKRGRGSRVTAMLLLCALWVGLIAPVAQAAFTPVSVQETTHSENRPVVTVEGNAVMENGKLTGFFELALFVRTVRYYHSPAGGSEVEVDKATYDAANEAYGAANAGAPDPDYTTKSHRFHEAWAAVKFNANLLTPVDWTVEEVTYATPGVPDANQAGVIDVTGAAAAKPVNLPSAKDQRVTTGAGRVWKYDATTPGSEWALLVLSAEATQQDAPIYEDDTAVVVVRFAYDLETYEAEMTVGGHSVELMRSLPSAVTVNAAGGATPAPSSAVWLATDAEAAASEAEQSVWYQGTASDSDLGRRYFYYTTNDAFASWSDTYTPAGSTAIAAPSTAGRVVLAKDTATYSLSDHLLTYNTELRATHVNESSYLSAGTNLDDVVTIVFYDWDDTLLGAVAVPAGDARSAVNAYVEKNMIHPDVRASAHPSDPLYWDNTVAGGIDRAYTYRGKFDFNGPQSTDTLHGSVANTAPDGDAFKLTAKLDYAFYKRATEVVRDPVYAMPGDPDSGLVSETRYWRYSTMTADDFPYVHGWAVVKNPEDLSSTWTTLGGGELQGINPKNIAGVSSMPAVGAEGQTLEFEDGGTDYHYQTSTTDVTGYFEFADFSGLDPATMGNTLIVKAVYEQGTDLHSGGFYAMTKQPYYTRYNINGSDVDGAYSIQYTLSRRVFRTDAGYNGVVGVARGRDLGIRLQTVTDPRVVSGDTEKQKISYSKVAVENVEEIAVDMIVSAVAYSVDYMLIDAYNNNIVGGSQRSDTNAAQLVDDRIPTNFKYDAPGITYAKRLGTPGIIFTATLNVVMEKATQYINGEITTVDFQNTLNLATLQDLNLRRTATDEEYTALTAATAVPLVIAAVQWAQDQHKLPVPNNTWWDTERDQADISYHELQQFIIDNDATSGTLIDDDHPYDAAAGTLAVTYEWCRQHAECIASAPDTVDDLPGLLAALWDGETAGDYTIVDNSTQPALVNRVDFSFRDTSEVVYTATDFNTALKAMVVAMKLAGVSETDFKAMDWNQVQYALLNSNAYIGSYAAKVESDANYWWAGGGQPVTNWNDLLAAAKIAAAGGSEAALNTAASIYANNVVSYGLKDHNGTSFVTFADFDDFKAKLIAALANPDVPASVTWDQIQYYIEHNAYDPVPSVMDDYGKDNYWWYNGGALLTSTSTLANLVSALTAARTGRPAVLNALDEALLYSNNAFQFRKSISGDQYAVADIQDFRDAVLALVNTPGYTNPTWEQIQYYLIHGTAVPAATASAEATYYWWRYGSTGGTAVNFNSGVSTVDIFLNKLLEAAWRSVVNGDVNAWTSSTLTATRLEFSRLVKADGPTDFASLTKLTTAEIITVMEDLVTFLLAGNTDPVPAVPTVASATWYQIQHYLLTYFASSGAAAVWDTDANIQTNENYWWLGFNTNPSVGSSPATVFQGLLDLLYEAATGGPATANDIASYLDIDTAQLIGFSYWNGNLIAAGDLWEINDVWQYMLDPGEGFDLDVYVSAAPDATGFLTFSQLQVAIWDWYVYDIPDSDFYMDDYGYPWPSWVTSASASPVRPFTVDTLTPLQAIEQPGVTTITTTETAVEDGVITLRVTTTTVAQGETVITTTVTVTTTKIHPDGRVETNTETTQTVEELPPLEAGETDEPGETPPDEDGETPPDEDGETPPDEDGETPPDDEAPENGGIFTPLTRWFGGLIAALPGPRRTVDAVQPPGILLSLAPWRTLSTQRRYWQLPDKTFALRPPLYTHIVGRLWP